MKRVVPGRAVAVMAALAGVLAAPAAIGTAAAQAAPAEPIVVIVLENKTYQTIVGSSNAPYIQSLIAGGTLYTNYQAAPGSLPDYLRMTGGIATTSAAKNSDNIFHQLQSAGISWGQYNESMPSACYTKSGPLPYNKNHNAAVWYNDITSNKAACANMLPCRVTSASTGVKSCCAHSSTNRWLARPSTAMPSKARTTAAVRWMRPSGSRRRCPAT